MNHSITAINIETHHKGLEWAYRVQNGLLCTEMFRWKICGNIRTFLTNINTALNALELVSFHAANKNKFHSIRTQYTRECHIISPQSRLKCRTRRCQVAHVIVFVRQARCEDLHQKLLRRCSQRGDQRHCRWMGAADPGSAFDDTTLWLSPPWTRSRDAYTASRAECDLMTREKRRIRTWPEG